MATKLWTGNSLAIAQIQTFAPGPQLPNTVISATINGKTVNYTSATGSNDDLVAGLIKVISGIVQQAPEFAEVAFVALGYVPAVPAPNATYLQMSSKVAGVPFTVSISLTTPAKATVSRSTAGKAGLNEVQQITISPNAESGSSFTLTWGGHTTSAIPTPASAPTSAAGSSGLLTGAYLWAVTFVTATGETELGIPSASLTLAAQEGSLTNIPIGPTGTTKRRIYRTKAGGSVYFPVTVINDNATTIYTDNVADGSLLVEPPPATNGVLQGELEALTGIGQGNVKVSGSNTAAVVGMTMPTSPIVYTIQFTGTLGGASQALVSGTVANVTILPPVSIVVTQVGCPPQSEIQTVGWKQVVGVASPVGSFTITLPGLNVTTASILFNASAATVQAALVAAAGPAYANAFTVALTQSTNAGYLYQITFGSPLNLQAVPLATVNVSGIVAAPGDTVTGYQAENQKGTVTGRNSIITVSLLNGPTGGTFGLTGTLANGGTISATGVAYNATVATLLGDFPANTVSVSGSTGGPYTIEAVGEAGTQAVTWTATSSLTGGSAGLGSPPSSNTATLSPPSSPAGVNSGATGALTPGTTYYYRITATDAAGETTGSAETSVTASTANTTNGISWTGVAGATGYKVYRGTSAGNENFLVLTLPYALGGTQNCFDSGPVNTTQSPPGSNTAGISVPSGLTAAIGGSGSLNGTYYYKITATNASGETTASSEVNAAPTGVFLSSSIGLNWSAVTGATGYNIYRGTVSGSENVLIASVGAQLEFIDAGGTKTSATPPSSNTSTLAAPVQGNASATTGTGALAAGTYYYEITATNANGETTASNEKSATLGSTGEITVNWATVSGATGYKIYRGTVSGSENAVVAIIVGGSTATYTDPGNIPAILTTTELTAGSTAVNEVQAVTITGATGGNFSLAYEGQGTGTMPFNDTSADVQNQLQALSTVGSGNFLVSGSNGGPFTVTAAGSLAAMPLPLIAANSSGLVGSSTATAPLTTTQSATGPNFWDNSNNWSPTGVPANGDSVYFQNSNVDCLYNLAQSATTLANLQIDMSFVNGEIGLPSWNGKYYEYRQQYLQIGVSGTILIGSGKGSGPTLVKLDTGTNAITMLVNNCGTSLDPTLPAILWKGNRSSGTTTLNIAKGSLGIAVYAGETATVDQINQGYVTNVKSDSSIFVGPGVTINTQWYMTGGQGTLNAACPSLLMENGTLTILDGLTATAVTTLSIVGGSVTDRSTGLITTLTVGTGATYDRSDDSRAKTVTNCTIVGKATFLDPNDTITFSNPLILSDCSLLDVTLDLGTNITVQRTASGVAPSSPLQNNAIVQGRLTLSSTLPVTTNDVTGASTLYFLPFRGDRVSLFNGSYWQSQSMPSDGLSLPLSGLTASLPYDVFLYSNNGTLTLQAVVWTNATTRATALATQNGIYVKSGASGYLYLGTIYTTGTGTTGDSQLNRLVWNYYNRVRRPMARFETASSWTYSSNTWRQANANVVNQVTAVVGVTEVEANLAVQALVTATVATGATFGSVAVGTNSTSTPDANCLGMEAVVNTNGYAQAAIARLDTMPAVGYNYWAWLELAGGGAITTTFYGAGGTPILRRSGIVGSING